MAAPEQTIPGLTDLRSFTHVLDFVANRAKYSKRIAYLEEKTQECNEAVQRVVALSALGSLQAQVKKDQLAAVEALVVAKEQAAEVQDKAQAGADALTTDLTQKQEAFRLHMSEEGERLTSWEEELERREEATNAKKTAASDELIRAEALNKAAVKMKEHYGSAVEKLRLITNEV